MLRSAGVPPPDRPAKSSGTAPPPAAVEKSARPTLCWLLCRLLIWPLGVATYVSTAQGWLLGTTASGHARATLRQFVDTAGNRLQVHTCAWSSTSVPAAVGVTEPPQRCRPAMWYSALMFWLAGREAPAVKLGAPRGTTVAALKKSVSPAGTAVTR